MKLFIAITDVRRNRRITRCNSRNDNPHRQAKARRSAKLSYKRRIRQKCRRSTSRLLSALRRASQNLDNDAIFIEDCEPSMADRDHASSAGLGLFSIVYDVAPIQSSELQPPSRPAVELGARMWLPRRTILREQENPQSSEQCGFRGVLAERAGFEPALGYYPKHAFQASSIHVNHAALRPLLYLLAQFWHTTGKIPDGDNP
ncbi:MAG: hypothetical protein QM739_14870 [Propionivibrio sp.]